MYHGKKISVAMATYNGEKYIREQLESICNQTVPPDEIIVSDDGSTDHTIEIVQDAANADFAKHTQIQLITDNPTHGFAYNFSHAISHCSGDIIFLSDQDDVWMCDKVERISDVYLKNPNALCVFHNASSIDSHGNPIDTVFNSFIQQISANMQPDEVLHLPCDPNCERSASAPLINGMVMSISAKLLETALPFPPISSQHDGWLWFCAEAQDCCYYLNKILTKRRLHFDNTSGAGKQGLNLHRVRKVLHHASKQTDIARIRIYIAKYMRAYITQFCDVEKPGIARALPTIDRVLEIGQKELAASKSGRLSGAAKLIKLYIKDVRYRKSGTKIFLYELIDILFRGKKERIKTLEAMGL